MAKKKGSANEAAKRLADYTKAVQVANQRLGRLHKAGKTNAFAYHANAEKVGTANFPYIKKTKGGAVRFATPTEYKKLDTDTQKKALKWVEGYNKLDTGSLRGLQQAEKNRFDEYKKKLSPELQNELKNVSYKALGRFWDIYKKQARDTADVIYKHIKDLADNTNILSMSEEEIEDIIKAFKKNEDTSKVEDYLDRKYPRLQWRK